MRPLYFLLTFIWVISACSTTNNNRLPANTLRGNAALQSGPMLGYAEMLEAVVWVQTKAAASVLVEYWEQGKTDKKWRTDAVQTEKLTGFTAKCMADQVQPGKTYDYQVWINGESVKLDYPCQFKTQQLWQWRTDPPAFTIAAGSCSYTNEAEYDRPGTPYGSDHHIFKSLAAKKPDAMVWLGDNFYLREADWFTRTGMIHRYTHGRSLPELQPLLASTSHFAIWDDHDYGPNDADGTFLQKDMSWDVFKSFWPNPTFGVAGEKGCTTMFQYGDVEFFLLDNRYFRTPNFCENCPNRTLLGQHQLEWLKGALAASYAPFKIIAIGGQVLTTHDDQETCFHFFPEERKQLLDFIEKENIKGVIFLTGDRHFSELSAYKNGSGNWVYDLTTSSLTAGVNKYGDKDVNEYRIPGTLAMKHNFALLNFSGPRKARELKIELIDADGQQIWNKTIGADGSLKN